MVPKFVLVVMVVEPKATCAVEDGATTTIAAMKKYCVGDATLGLFVVACFFPSLGDSFWLCYHDATEEDES